MRVLFLFALVLSLVACDSKIDEQKTDEQKTDETTTTADSTPPVVYAEGDDPEMNAAITHARMELDTFIATLKSPQSSQSKFGVKVGIPHAAGTEHLWLGQPVFDGDSVSGVIEDVPVYAQHVKKGDAIRVNRHGVSDWMFMEDGKLRGGYTMRVAVERLPSDQRGEQKKRLGIEP